MGIGRKIRTFPGPAQQLAIARAPHYDARVGALNGGKQRIDSTELETKTFTVAGLLEAIRKGKVRIPRFQRGYRWTDEDRRLLFDSLQSGYPIGTLLLARGAAPAGTVRLGGYLGAVAETHDALWVVDGQQRLATLATALLEDHSGAYRPIFFDLDQNEFVLGSLRRASPPQWIPTSALANSSSLNRWIRESGTSDALTDRADEVARRVREYAIPAYLVPFDGSDDKLLRQIFARINRRGRALASHEVFEALHASGPDGKPIQRAVEDLAQLGFGTLDAAVIERAAIAVAGGDPGRTLQDQTEESNVPQLFEQVTSGLARAIEFLAGDAYVPHVELLPYSGALSTLGRFFAVHSRPHPRNRELLARWFWRGTLSGALRTDNRLDRKRWQAIDGNEHESVQRLLRLLPALTTGQLPHDLAQPFRRNSARSQIELLALCSLGPRVLVGEDRGTEISIAALLADGPRNLPSELVKTPEGQEVTLASQIVHPKVNEADFEELLRTPPTPELLATHAIAPAAFEALRNGDIPTFLRLRRAEIEQALTSFVFERASLDPPDRDRAPLAAYFEEESA